MESTDLTKKLYTALKLAEAKLAEVEQQQTEPIAIIGMAGRFPDADDLEQFWQNLYNGHSSVKNIPADRWDTDLFHDENPDAPGKSYCSSGSFLTDIKGFDAAFFNILPVEAKQMAPQQRMLLETSWQALESANIKPSTLQSSDTSVYMGIADDDYSYITAGDKGIALNPHSVTGRSLSTASGRISYFMGLQGANMVVQTACSSSLAAVDLGMQELRSHKTNLVLAGGINHILLPYGYMALSRTRALSADGTCKSFDASADGYGRGEGCGIVVLKRYSDALKNGDNILAIIKGSAVNQDGQSNGITAPNGTAQERVILKSLQNANVDASKITFVEAHGTGTKLGDPIEMEVLGKVYAKNRATDNPLYVSTVKTNIGHLEAAAGIASLIKTTLALQNRIIPANLHFKNPNNTIPWEPAITIATTPVILPQEQIPVTAAISSFGFSGTNVHMIVESVNKTSQMEVADNEPAVLLLSAKDTISLNQLAHSYIKYLNQTNYSLNDICFTAANHRDHFAIRLAVIAANKADAADLLTSFDANSSAKTLTSSSLTDHAALASIANEYIAGADVDSFIIKFSGRAVTIPVYQFHHQDYWVDSDIYLELTRQKEVAEATTQAANISVQQIPQEDAESYLYQILAEITELPISQIRPDDDFFAIGMDSISLVQLKQKISTDRAINIEVSSFYDQLNTLNKLTTYLQQQHSDASPYIAPSSHQQQQMPAAAREASKTFVPYKKINLAQEQLDNAKDNAIQQLITDVNRLTSSSKTHTQQYRSWLANNRNIAGFRPRWKEMTYQLVAAQGQGAYVWDADGNRFLDFSMGFGVNLFGYNPPFVQQSLHQVVDDQLVLGALSPMAGQLAEAICTITGNERAAFYNTGTEAVMVAIRLARAITGKNKIVLFAGSYHGTYDGILAREGNGIYAEPLAPGVSPSMVQDVLVLNYGNMADLNIIRDMAHELAAILVEPVQSRHPDLFPVEFLKELELITTQNDVALIFDEVISGFRFSLTGIQQFIDIKPDITIYGKVIGGGIPIGVVAGKSKFLDAVDGGFWSYGDQSYPTSKSTFVAGTFCHHPMAMAAGLSVLNYLQQNPDTYTQLNNGTDYICNELNDWFKQTKLGMRMIHFGSLFRFVLKGNEELLYYKLLAKGIYIWEGRNCYLSTAHTQADIEQFITAVKESCLELINESWLIINDTPATSLIITALQDTILLSPAQKGVWWAQQLSHSASFNLSESFLVNGPFNLTVFEDACKIIINRHEILRTSFGDQDGEPFQTIKQEFSFKIDQTSLMNLSEAEAILEAQRVLLSKIKVPFSLSQAPLFNILVHHVAHNKLVLTVIVHHIVCDGWALEVLFDEIIIAYNQLLTSSDSTDTDDTKLQYRHYIHEAVNHPDLGALQQYWHKQVSGINTLVLPGDAGTANTVNEAYDEVLIDGEDYTRLLALVKQQHVSSFTMLCAVTKMLLYTYTGINDIAVGTPVPGRVQTKWNKLIGLCLNMLVLRSKLVPEDTFVNYLQQLQSIILYAYEKQEYSFELLRNECPGDRLPNEMPFFEIEIAMQNFRMHRHNKNLNFTDLQITPFTDLSFDSRKYPIEFRFDEGHSDVLLKVAYDPGRYSQAFIKQLLTDWQQLLQLVMHLTPATTVDELVSLLKQQKVQAQHNSLKNNRQNNFSKLISTSN